MVFNQSKYHKKWRLRNKRKLAAYMRKYRKKNPDYVKENIEKNKERRKAK